MKKWINFKKYIDWFIFDNIIYSFSCFMYYEYNVNIIILGTII